MHNWRTNTEELTLNHFEGNRVTYKCLHAETYDYRVQKYLANFGFKEGIHFRSFIIMNQGNIQDLSSAFTMSG